jgi:phosphoribosylaminoimidazolecarboxamide formyltransferase/IMP cyclohydrolase
VAVNRPLDGPTANAICEIFTEVVVAPGADDAAREAFARKKNLRLLLIDSLPEANRAGLVTVPIAGACWFRTATTARSRARTSRS